MGMGNHSNVWSVRAVVLFKLQRFANAKLYKFSWGLNGYPRSTFSVFSAIWMRPRKTNPSPNTRENRLSGTTIRLLGVFVPLSSSNCKDSQMQSSITFKFSWGLNGYQRSTFSVFSLGESGQGRRIQALTAEKTNSVGHERVRWLMRPETNRLQTAFSKPDRNLAALLYHS